MQYQPLNRGRISARTGKNTVAIVGFAKSTRHLVPYEDMETEIWGINDAYHVKGFMKRWDRWFQLHPISYLAIQDNSPSARFTACGLSTIFNLLPRASTTSRSRAQCVTCPSTSVISLPSSAVAITAIRAIFE